jgi:hypothetical protein
MLFDGSIGVSLKENKIYEKCTEEVFVDYFGDPMFWVHREE